MAGSPLFPPATKPTCAVQIACVSPRLTKSTSARFQSKLATWSYFTETTTHGALSWRGNHQRRMILTRYCPGFIAFHRMKQSLVDPEYMADMTDEQRAVLAPPHFRGHWQVLCRPLACIVID